jgi:hypothetical protein
MGTAQTVQLHLKAMEKPLHPCVCGGSDGSAIPIRIILGLREGIAQYFIERDLH